MTTFETLYSVENHVSKRVYWFGNKESCEQWIRDYCYVVVEIDGQTFYVA